MSAGKCSIFQRSIKSSLLTRHCMEKARWWALYATKPRTLVWPTQTGRLIRNITTSSLFCLWKEIFRVRASGDNFWTELCCPCHQWAVDQFVYRAPKGPSVFLRKWASSKWDNLLKACVDLDCSSFFITWKNCEINFNLRILGMSFL